MVLEKKSGVLHLFWEVAGRKRDSEERVAWRFQQLNPLFVQCLSVDQEVALNYVSSIMPAMPATIFPAMMTAD